ncbi:hypothetical protein Tfer_3292 [Thermincola ferriacetica]|uniref:HTH arsR-type domain-containing protein n=1 Tax=Thermincola ferriacetica TaxID=281456 RepID=A0A0L6VYE5_9FIRM|nr:hypothetical protein Tfer_3292 [Thermincola ferriacetica]
MNIDILKNLDELLKKTADGVQSYRRNKNKLNGLIRDFFNFVSKYYGVKIDVDTYFPPLNFREKTERMIEILKYLHEGPKTREEISAYFSITERTLSDYLNELQRGDYSFLGYSMKINLKRGENTYDSTIHPVFLPLNLSEVYALTVGLKLTGRKTVFKDIYDYIADCIYDQLSSYGKRRISEKAKEKGIFFDDNHIRAYRFEEDILDSKRQKMFAYFLKSGALCKIEYDTKEGLKTVVGRVDFAKEGNDYLTTKILVINDEQEKIKIDIDRIISIEFAN